MSDSDPLHDLTATRRRARPRFLSSCDRSLPIHRRACSKSVLRRHRSLRSAIDSFRRRGRGSARGSIRLSLFCHREEGAAYLPVAILRVARRKRSRSRGPRPSRCRHHTVLRGSPPRSLHIQSDGPRLRRQDVSRRASREVPLAGPTISARLPFAGGSRNATGARHAFE